MTMPRATLSAAGLSASTLVNHHAAYAGGSADLLGEIGGQRLNVDAARRNVAVIAGVIGVVVIIVSATAVV